MKLIDKDALVAEINNMLNTKEHTSHSDEMAFNSGRWKALKKVKDIIDTLEVKDVVRINTSLSDIDDDLKKLGVDPDSKQAKMLKDCYYRAIDR